MNSKVLRKKIEDREGGYLFYGLTPPKISTDEEKITAIAQRQMDRLEGLDIEGIDYVHSSNHWLLTAMNIASRYPTIKNFLWGVNNGIKAVGDSGGDFPFLPRSWQFTIAFDQYVHNMGKDGGQRLWPPCSFMTKIQMWDTIPNEVKPLVQSCGRPLKYDGVSPCGECFKCNEFKTMLDGVPPKP